MLLQNTFEGGTNGQVITTGNSGGASGNAFDNIVGSPQYTNTQRRGNLAAYNPTVGADVHMDWTSAGQSGDTFCARLYMYLVSGPTNFQRLLVVMNGSSSFVASLWVFGSTIYLYSGLADAQKAVSSAVPTGQWIRVELRLTINTSNSGTGEVYIYNSPDSTTPSQTLTSGTTTWPGRNPSIVEFHLQRDSGGYWFLDDIGVDATLLGPVAIPKAGTDTGALAEQAAVAVAPERSDSGTLAEQGVVEFTLADPAALTEQAVAAPTVTRIDTGTLADQAGVHVAHSRADDATVTEQAQVEVTHTRTDGASLAEGIPFVGVTLADAAGLAEQIDIDELLGPAVADLVRLTERAAATGAVTGSDGGALTEQNAVDVLRFGTDSASLAEASVIGIPGSDGAAVAELAVVHAGLAVADAAAVGELAQAVQPVAASDAALLEEAALVISFGGDVTRAGPPYTEWAASPPFK